MKARTLCVVLLVMLLGYCSFAAERPNVILVMCDDLGWGDVGFNGGQIIRTPHLDQMAQNSLKFHRFYAQSPVCSPTRGACLTGRHSFRYGIYFANTGHMKPQEWTLAELLQQSGYATGHFGKWHLGTLTKTVKEGNRGGDPKHVAHYSTPAQNGFDVCFSTEAKVPTYDPMLKPRQNSGSAWDAIVDPSQAVPYGTHYWDETEKIVTENLDGDDSRIIMDRAIPFIEQACSREQPFFAIIWFHTPHLPVVASPRHRALYAENLSVLHRNYYGSVSAMDEQVGRLRETLRKLGVAENTMVCFCSDNGPEGQSTAPGSAGPFRGRKRSLYEGGVRVPGLIEWPTKIDGGRETDFPAVTSDYLPTILDIVGVPFGPGAQDADPRPLDGVSLLPVFEGSITERSRPIGFQSRDMGALSDNRFKLYGNPKKNAWQLYDLIDDPAEAKDIAAEHPQVVASMVDTFTRWQASCAASDRGDDYEKRK